MIAVRSLVGFVAFLGIVTTACAPYSRAAVPAEVKGGGGEFQVALPTEPRSLNPDIRADDAANIVAQNVFNKLVSLDADYQIIPDLAESWDVSSDGLGYTFHLAKTARWHDGQPFTSGDVKWTLEAIQSNKGFAQDTVGRIDSIDVPDSTTVVVRLKEAWSPFLPMLAFYGTFILPRHLYQAGGWAENPANDTPIGTGPFKFVEWVKGDRITLAVNPAYFRRGPYVERLVLRFFKNPSVDAIDLLQADELDYTLARPSYSRIAELLKTPNLAIRTFPHPARYYLSFNLARSPFDDLRVRQAVNKAIDRTGLVDTALLGYGSPAEGFYTPAIAWAYNPKAAPPPFDVAAAAALLTEAGLAPDKDGRRATWTLVTQKISPFIEIGAVLADQLQAAGVTISLTLLSGADFSKQVVEKHDYDLALTDGSWGPDPDNLATRFGSSGSFNLPGYGRPEYDAALAEGARKTSLAERAKSYFTAQEILARDLPLAPLAEYVQVLIYNRRVSGLPQTEARGLVTFYDFSLVRLGQ